MLHFDTSKFVVEFERVKIAHKAMGHKQRWDITKCKQMETFTKRKHKTVGQLITFG